MAVLLDTAALPPDARGDAARGALASAVSPTRVEVLPNASCRVSAWEFGRGVRLVQVSSSGHRLTRTPAHLRLDAPERVSLGITVAGAGRMTHRDLVPAQRRELLLVDETSPYDFELVGQSTSQAVLVEYRELGLPVDVVRRAVPRLRESPLYGLVERHVAQLPALADELPQGPARAMLEQATLDLVRGLISSAASGGLSEVGDTPAALYSRTLTFVRQHQRDVDLSAARLAKEQHVSVRALYAAFAAHQERLSETVVRGRLEGARRELAVSPSTRTVAAIAYGWGFRDPRHFGRRFRQAFGLSPGEWRAVHAPGRSRPALVDATSDAVRVPTQRR
jgi:AraC-like DNA-binding protein